MEEVWIEEEPPAEEAPPVSCICAVVVLCCLSRRCADEGRELLRKRGVRMMMVRFGVGCGRKDVALRPPTIESHVAVLLSSNIAPLPMKFARGFALIALFAFAAKATQSAQP